MKDFVWDAVPSQRQQKVEKYDYPVMTMAALTKPGAGRKFSFNKAAQELLGIKGEDRISFGFNADRSIVAVRKADEGYGFKLTKTCTLSDKKTFEFISKTLELSNDVENEFKVVNDEGYSKLELMKDAISNDEVEEAVYSTKEEVLDDSAGNVDYPTVDDKLDAELEVTPSEDVTNETW
jgi:hypothetical protein